MLQSVELQGVGHDRVTSLNGTIVLRASLVAQAVKNLPVMQKTWVQSLG